MSRLFAAAASLCSLLAAVAATDAAAAASQQQQVAQQQRGQTTGGVQQVIKMMEAMSAQAKKEKDEEEIAYAKFTGWCSAEADNLDNDIKDGEDKIESIKTEIAKLGTDVKALGRDIGKLNGDVDEFEGELKGETKERKVDHNDFEKTEKDLDEAVDGLDVAVNKLRKKASDASSDAAMSMAMAFVQTSSTARLSADKAEAAAEAFLGVSLDDADEESMHTGHIDKKAVNMVKKLEDDFHGKLDTVQKEEANAQHAFNSIATDLENSIGNTQRTAKEEEQEKERKAAKRALLTRQLKGTQYDLEADKKTLGEMKIECREKSYSFHEKQKLRGEEIEAIGKATDILKSPDVLGTQEKHMSAAQTSSAMSLLQEGRSQALFKAQGLRRHIRDFLSSEGRRLHSKSIELLAEKIKADPFAKVKDLIHSMIVRLNEEGAKDAQREGFCDAEMGKSKITRTKLNEDVDALTASIDDGKASVITLTEDSAQLTKEVESLNKAMGEAAELREAEKEKNKETIADAQAAQAAVEKATQVLKDFYEKAGAVLMQSRASSGGFKVDVGIKLGSDEWKALANPNFEAPTKGRQEAAKEVIETGEEAAQNGVMGMLEVIMSDFASLEADTKSAEEVSSKSHAKFMHEGKVSKATKERKIEMNNSDRVNAESKLQEDSADLKTTQDKLSAAERYFKELEPQCTDKTMTKEEYKKAKKEEIKSLREALKILDSSD